MMKSKKNLCSHYLMQLSQYISDAKQFGNINSNCCFFSTSGKDNRPSVRIITIHKVTDEGLLFLADTNSGKTKQFSENPHIGLCFYWPEIELQATIEGKVTVLEQETSEELWQLKDYQSQITAWAIKTLNEEKESHDSTNNDNLDSIMHQKKKAIKQ